MKLLIAEAILNAFPNEGDAMVFEVTVENNFLSTFPCRFDLVRGKMNGE